MKGKNRLILLIFGTLAVIGFCFRWTFVYKFDPVYWENFYYTSQWNIPNSQRVIGDEGVYRYIGYRRVNGENPFNVDYWVPPMGKFFYGLSAKYLSNPYWTSWGWYLLLLIAIYGISKSWWAVLILMTNPLIVSQIGLTMLDLPQAVMLAGQIYFILSGNYVLSGLFLGLMMGIKIGYFGPVIVVIGTCYLWKRTKSFIEVIKYLIAVPLGYTLSYFCYFAVHPNPIPWIRLHEKIITFWKNSGASPNPINTVGYILINKYNQVLEGGRVWMSAREWTLLLPISLCITFKELWSKNDKQKYLSLVAMGWIILCLLIDFWPRYLISVVPVLTIVTVNFFEKHKQWLWVILLMNLWGLRAVLNPTLEPEIRQVERSIKYKTYKEIYQMGSSSFKMRFKEEGYGTNLDWEKMKIIYKKENNKWVISDIYNPNGMERYATIVNPVRSRQLWKDKSLAPIAAQYGAIKNNGLMATWLLQNDVLVDKELVNKIKSFDENQELGIFIEVSKDLAYKSRVYYPTETEWYSPKAVFLSAYEIGDRKKLIDRMMTNFKNTFGYFPKSAGAWWIDSFSQQYLENKYGVRSFLICADQRTTDKYGIWGQWWGYPYIPSPSNILIPGESNSVVIQ